MSIFTDSAIISTAVNQTSRVVTSLSQSSQGIFSGIQGVSASDIKNSAFNGLTNVGTGIVNSLPGVATGLGSAAQAVGAIGAMTGNSSLLRTAGSIAGAAGAIAGVSNAISTISNAVGAVVSVFGGGSGGGGGGGGAGGGPTANPLHAYASYTYQFGLFALTDGQVNGGARSGGIPIIQMPNGFTVGATTYIDNVRITGMVGLDQSTGNSNALGVSFTVIEPYSMGKFWETLQTAALMAGHQNYNLAPYMFSIKFKGHGSHEAPGITVPKTDRYMHIKIRNINMRVTKKGAEYEIDAFPWSEGGFSKTFAEIKTDSAISCNKGGPYKVKDVLKFAEKSLKETINKKLKDDKDRKKTVSYAHEIEICFPPPPYTSNSDGNVIGEADLGLSQYNRADNQFAKENATYDAATGIYKRGEVQIDTKNGDYKFAQGSSVQDIINQIILSSDYARRALENPGNTVDWWRIETHFHNISGVEDPKTGEKAKKVIFRIVPYKVDAALFFPPNTSTAPPAVVREYEWLYTGKNHDIIDWNIEYNAGFYRSFNADGGANSDDKNIASRSSNAAPTKSGGSTPEAEPDGVGGPEATKRDKPESKTTKSGGASFDDASTRAARQFHDIATNGTDMMHLDLVILGDPYYIGDSGFGNFTIPGSGPENVEGSLNWQEGMVYVKARFRMPEDANTATGLYDFGNPGKPVREFSGYFKVQNVESTFNRGKFTQRLGLIKKIGIVDPGAGRFPPKEPNPEDPGIYYP